MNEKRIYKYQLIPDHEWRATVDMPMGANVLSTDFQPTERGVMVWAAVDEGVKLVRRTFLVVPTGQPFDCEDTYFIGTVQRQEPLMGSILVFHIFEVRE